MAWTWKKTAPTICLQQLHLLPICKKDDNKETIKKKNKNLPLNKTDGVLFQERSEGSTLNSQNDFVLFPTTTKSNRGSSLFALIDEENSIFQQRDINGCLSILGESKYVFSKQKI